MEINGLFDSGNLTKGGSPLVSKTVSFRDLKDSTEK
jgi:hypothetical protein